MMKSLVTYLFLFLAFGIVSAQTVKKDSSFQKKVVQFSGIITEGDSLYGVSGAAIISLNSGTGANSNMMGYFSMPVFEGDSILVAAFGFKKKYFIIPRDTGYSYSVMIQMQQDTIILPDIDLRAFPSEEVFKQVLLAMELPNENEYSNMQVNLNAQILARLQYRADVTPGAAFRNSMDRQANALQQKYVVTMNPLTNPFAWARFIQEVKLQKAKKEQEEKEKKNYKSY